MKTSSVPPELTNPAEKGSAWATLLNTWVAFHIGEEIRACAFTSPVTHRSRPAVTSLEKLAALVPVTDSGAETTTPPAALTLIFTEPATPKLKSCAVLV